MTVQVAITLSLVIGIIVGYYVTAHYLRVGKVA